MNHKSALIQQFTERGYMHQATNLEGLDETATQQIVPTYIGFDCTADSLHVGSLVQIMMLRIIQKCGHKPIVLMGGGTTKVGDPSGKDTARPLLSDQDIEHNKQGIKKCLREISDLWRWPNRRGDGRQCRLAGQSCYMCGFCAITDRISRSTG